MKAEQSHLEVVDRDSNKNIMRSHRLFRAFDALSSSSSWSAKKRWQDSSSEDDEPDAESIEGSDRTRSRLLMRGLLIAEHMDATLREELLLPLLVVARDGLLDDVFVTCTEDDFVDAVPNERAEVSSGPVSVEGNLITCVGRQRFMGFAEIVMFIMSVTFIIDWITIVLIGR